VSEHEDKVWRGKVMVQVGSRSSVMRQEHQGHYLPAVGYIDQKFYSMDLLCIPRLSEFCCSRSK
jgi:hypothetical protein